MATLLDLERTGAVSRIDPELNPRIQELRLIYTSPGVQQWIEQVLPTLESTWKVEESPIEQLTALIEIFCAGDTLSFGWQFNPLRPHRNGVWELKTADLRMFGWFSAKDCFVVAAAVMADRINDHGPYARYDGRVLGFRDDRDLDEPKFISGDDPHAVDSDFSYP